LQQKTGKGRAMDGREASFVYRGGVCAMREKDEREGGTETHKGRGGKAVLFRRKGTAHAKKKEKNATRKSSQWKKLLNQVGEGWLPEERKVSGGGRGPKETR